MSIERELPIHQDTRETYVVKGLSSAIRETAVDQQKRSQCILLSKVVHLHL